MMRNEREKGMEEYKRPVASTGANLKAVTGVLRKWRCKDKTVNHPARYPGPKSDPCLFSPPPPPPPPLHSCFLLQLE